MLNNLSNKTNAIIKIVGYPDLEDFVIQVVGMETPTFSIPAVVVPSNPRGHGRAKLSGSTLEHEQIQVRIIIDRELNSYLSIYRWMLRISNYQTGVNTAQFDNQSPVAIQMHILNNIKTDIMLTFNLIDAFPINMSSLEYDYTEEGDPVVMCNIAFDCKRVDLEKDGQIITG